MDSEGIVEDNQGNLWFCDEYGASVWKVNKTTLEVIKRYTPFPTETEDAALPAVIGRRRANRGFEGIAYTPNGKIYAFVQSPADNPNTAAGNTGRLLRMVEIDPETDAVRQFAYEINPQTGQIRTRDWKIGDLVAVNNNEFLLIEHAERNGWNVKNIYKINISNATPLNTEDYNGQTLEQVGTAANLAAFGVNVVEKELVLDLLEAGWDLTHDKPEGLTILNDSTIAVVNDNDFGINSPAGDGSIVYTGKTTRLYIFGLRNGLDYQSPYCSYEFAQTSVEDCTGETVVLDAGADFDAYQWSDNSTNQTLEVTNAGIYAVTVTNAVGCKSGDAVTVVFNPTSASEQSFGVCPGEVVDYNGTILMAGDTVQFVLTNAFGCDSVLTISAFEFTPVQVNLGEDVTITEPETATLDAGSGFVAYLWSDGSTGQTLTVAETGTYSVTTTDVNGCQTTDEIVVTVITGTGEASLEGQLTLFPNPSSGLVKLSFEDFRNGEYRLELYDVLGRAILMQEFEIQSSAVTRQLDLTHLPKGAYTVHLATEGGTVVRKLILE